MNLQPLAAAAERVIGAVHREDAAAAVEVGEIAGLEMLPAAIGHAGRKHGIEQGAARGRKYKPPLLRPEAARVLAGAGQIRAIATEALRAEVIRYAAPGDVRQAQCEAVGEPPAVTLRGANTHHEAISGERAPREPSRVRMRFEHLQFRRAPRGPAFGGARFWHRETLDGK